MKKKMRGQCAMDMKVKSDAQQTARRIRGARAGHGGAERIEWMAALADDVDDVGRHASSQGYEQHLYRRGTRCAVTVDDRSDASALRAEPQLLRADELGGNGRFDHDGQRYLLPLTFALFFFKQKTAYEI